MRRWNWCDLSAETWRGSRYESPTTENLWGLDSVTDYIGSPECVDLATYNGHLDLFVELPSADQLNAATAFIAENAGPDLWEYAWQHLKPPWESEQAELVPPEEQSPDCSETQHRRGVTFMYDVIRPPHPN